jgi:hypothetical protein
VIIWTRVNAQMGVREDPAAGLIVHVVTEIPAGCHLGDVWESTEQYEEFRDSRLGRALGKVMAERGQASPDGGIPDPVITPVLDLVHGRWRLPSVREAACSPPLLTGLGDQTSRQVQLRLLRLTRGAGLPGLRRIR